MSEHQLEQSDLIIVSSDFSEVENGDERASLFARLNASLHEHYELPTDKREQENDERLQALNATIAQVGINLKRKADKEASIEKARLASLEARRRKQPEGNEPEGRLSTADVKGSNRKSVKGTVRTKGGREYNIPKIGADENFAAEQAERELLLEVEQEIPYDETV